MYFFYSLLFIAACIAALPYYALLLIVRPEVRRGFGERFGLLPASLRHHRRPTIWVHAVSVGEVRAARRILQGLAAEHGDHRLVLSVTTPSGRQVAEGEDLPVEGLFHFPLDLPGLPGRVLDVLDCRMFITIETEIWPNLLRACGRRGVPAILLNGRVSDRSFRRYRRLRRLLRVVLNRMTFAGMQTWDDAERLAWMGMPVHRMEVTGSVKFDVEIAPLARDHPLVRYLGRRGGPVWVVASTAEGEEAAVLEAARRVFAARPDALLLLAPRKPERFDEVARLLRNSGLPWARRTQLPGGAGPGTRILLLDTLGELAGAYHEADVAFVGGSLVRRGGHNIIEPAACGVPVLFGPHVFNFREVARLLKDGGGAAQVRGPEDMAREVIRLLEDDELRRTLGARARAVVESSGGAVEASLRIVRHFLKRQGPGPRRLLPVRHFPHHGSLTLEEHPSGVTGRGGGR